MNPTLTNISDADKKALRSGLSHTIAEFSYDPMNPGIASVSLLYQVNTKKLFSQSDDPNHLDLGYITTTLPLLGDWEQNLQDFADQYLQILSDAGRVTPLTSKILYFWLYMMWPNVRTHLIKAAQRSQFGWAGSPYMMSFWCPQTPPPALEFTSDDYWLPTKPVEPPPPTETPSYKVTVESFIPAQYLSSSTPPSNPIVIPLTVTRIGGHVAPINTTLTISHTEGSGSSYGGYGGGSGYSSAYDYNIHWETQQGSFFSGSDVLTYDMASGEQGYVEDLPSAFTISTTFPGLPSNPSGSISYTGWLHCDDGSEGGEQDIELQIIVTGFAISLTVTPLYAQSLSAQDLHIDPSGTLVYTSTLEPVTSIDVRLDFYQNIPAPTTASIDMDLIAAGGAWVGSEPRFKLKHGSSYIPYQFGWFSFSTTEVGQHTSAILTLELDPYNWPTSYTSLDFYASGVLGGTYTWGDSLILNMS